MSEGAKKWGFLLLATVLLFAVILVLWYRNTTPINPVDALRQENQDFRAGSEAQNNGDYSEALASYQAVLPTVDDPDQRQVLNFRIALMNELSGSYVPAIAEFKAIASAATTSPNARIVSAYAIQELGKMYDYQKWLSPDNAKVITAAIFSDEPYAGFQQQADGDLSVAYRNLFQYAASIYPLGYAEARIAGWYANDVAITLGGATTTPQGIADVSAATQALQKADADVQRTDDPKNSSYAFIPAILQLEGVALGQLASVGAGSPEQAETYFKQSLAMASSSIPVSFTVYDYALFLSKQYGRSRVSDIVPLLAPLQSVQANGASLSLKEFLTTIRTGRANTTYKNGAVRLASLDPDFKTYLLSLGWHPSDF